MLDFELIGFGAETMIVVIVDAHMIAKLVNYCGSEAPCGLLGCKN